jgi:hypothetical protein
MPTAGGRLSHGTDFRPSRVYHRDGHAWLVTEVMCHWEHPASAPAWVTLSCMVECWRLRVSGPLPGDPGQHGAFTMTARTAGNRPGWELEPGPEACECWQS